MEAIGSDNPHAPSHAPSPPTRPPLTEEQDGGEDGRHAAEGACQSSSVQLRPHVKDQDAPGVAVVGVADHVDRVSKVRPILVHQHKPTGYHFCCTGDHEVLPSPPLQRLRDINCKYNIDTRNRNLPSYL